MWLIDLFNIMDLFKHEMMKMKELKRKCLHTQLIVKSTLLMHSKEKRINTY